MREIGLTFSDSMVRAILAGRKWQTRRPIATKPPRADPEDWIWVREAWDCEIELLAGFTRNGPDVGERLKRGTARYRASGHNPCPPNNNWRPSIHMPKWAARLMLPLVRVWEESVQEITETDAQAEGFPVNHIGEPYTPPQADPWQGYGRASFFLAWGKIYGNRPALSWGSNPVVRVYEWDTPVEIM